VHRSWIISFARTVSFDHVNVYCDEIAIPIGARFRKQLFERIKIVIDASDIDALTAQKILEGSVS
jgi:hypothetical protein